MFASTPCSSPARMPGTEPQEARRLKLQRGPDRHGADRPRWTIAWNPRVVDRPRRRRRRSRRARKTVGSCGQAACALVEAVCHQSADEMRRRAVLGSAHERTQRASPDAKFLHDRRPWLPSRRRPSAAMQKSVPVGLELYSVRDELRKDLPGTVTAVGEDGLPGRRVLRAVFRLDAGSREGRAQAAGRSRHPVPVDATTAAVVHARRAEEGDRAQSDHRQQEHHHVERRRRRRASTAGSRSPRS